MVSHVQEIQAENGNQKETKYKDPTSLAHQISSHKSALNLKKICIRFAFVAMVIISNKGSMKKARKGILKKAKNGILYTSCL